MKTRPSGISKMSFADYRERTSCAHINPSSRTRIFIYNIIQPALSLPLPTFIIIPTQHHTADSSVHQTLLTTDLELQTTTMDTNSTSQTPQDVQIPTDLNLTNDVKVGTRRRMLGWARYLQYAEMKTPAKAR